MRKHRPAGPSSSRGRSVSRKSFYGPDLPAYSVGSVVDPFTGELTNTGLAILRSAEDRYTAIEAQSERALRWLQRRGIEASARQDRYKAGPNLKVTSVAAAKLHGFQAAWAIHDYTDERTTRERHLDRQKDPRYAADSQRIQHEDLDCVRSKDTRRHMVIRSGHGGRNGFTDYKKQEDCK